jgi:hypothetical protein
MEKKYKFFISSIIDTWLGTKYAEFLYAIMHYFNNQYMPIAGIFPYTGVDKLALLVENKIDVLILVIPKVFVSSNRYRNRIDEIEQEYNYARQMGMNLIIFIENSLLSEGKIKNRRHKFVQKLLETSPVYQVRTFFDAKDLLQLIELLLNTYTTPENNEELIEVEEEANRLVIYVEPGTASPEDIGLLMVEISNLYRMVGGTGINFKPEEVRLPIYEYE